MPSAKVASRNAQGEAPLITTDFTEMIDLFSLGGALNVLIGGMITDDGFKHIHMN